MEKEPCIFMLQEMNIILTQILFANWKILSCAESTLDHRSQSPYVISVGALDANGVKSSYSTPGSATQVIGLAEYGYDSNIYSGLTAVEDDMQ